MLAGQQADQHWCKYLLQVYAVQQQLQGIAPYVFWEVQYRLMCLCVVT